MPRQYTPKVEYVCANCGIHFWKPPSYAKGRSEVCCSAACGFKNRSRRMIEVPLETHFLQRVQPSPTSDCLLWTGCISVYGYGCVKRKTPGGKPLQAHRVAWELRHGPIPPGLCVLHRCDNRSCVNVEHLFLGTQADNMADMIAKGRGAKGNRYPQAKLSPDAVVEIRRRYAAEGVIRQEMADEFGVAKTTIKSVINGRTWRHVI